MMPVITLAVASVFARKSRKGSRGASVRRSTYTNRAPSRTEAAISVIVDALVQPSCVARVSA